MIVLRDPAPLAAPDANAGTAELIDPLKLPLQQLFADLAGGEPYDPDGHGYLVLVETGDDVATLERDTGCPILTDWSGQRRYGDPDFSPACEWLNEYPDYYEMGYVLNDSGAALLLIIPKLTGIATELLSLCGDHAEPVPA
jgi:hypothetical protein